MARGHIPHSPRYKRENGQLDPWVRYLSGGLPSKPEEVEGKPPPERVPGQISRGVHADQAPGDERQVLRKGSATADV